VNETTWERRLAASGFAWLMLGAAGGAMERGWPSASDPAAVARFIAENRPAILAQSVFFLLSAGVAILFLGCLRSFLGRAEGGRGGLSSVAFGAGLVWAGISMVAQGVQVGIAMPSSGEVPSALLWTMSSIFGVANLPLGVMLIATTAVTLTTRAFPLWLGTLSAAAAAGQLVLCAGTVIRSGPLAPNGWLTYVLYPLFLVWLVPATILLIRRPRQASMQEVPGRPEAA
jgi:hypothetical protein